MEKIIYSPALNKTEYLRSLSLMGVESFNLRIFNFVELISEANIRLGLVSKKPLINSSYEEFFALDVLNDIGESPSSFDDVKHLLSSLKEVRKCIIADNEYEDFLTRLDSFKENENFIYLSKFYKAYLEKISEEEFIDPISLARLLFGKGKIYDEVIILKEDLLSPLEKELLYELSNKVIEKDYASLYPKKERKEIGGITPYYGNISEVDGVISNILENNYKFSDVTLVTPSNNEYSYLLFEKFLSFGIPFTSEFGIPLKASGPYLLYKTLYDLRNTYSFTYKGFKDLFACPYFDVSKIADDGVDFDVLAKICGNLRIQFDNKPQNVRALTSLKYLNEYKHDYLVEFIRHIDKRVDPEKMISLTFNIINIFSKGLIQIIKTYFIDNTSFKDEDTKKYVDNLNTLAIEYITKIIEQSYEIDDISLRISYVKLLDNKYIFPKSFNDKGIHITSLNKAISTLRKHVYFMDFDASSFPGRAVEDYLFNDCEYELLTGIASRSELLISHNNSLLRSLIEIYLNAGSDVTLSYRLLNVIDSSTNNPSSVLLEYDSKINKEGELNTRIKKNRYFSNKVSSLNSLVDEALSNEERKLKDKPVIDIYQKYDLSRYSFSPSNISNFFECPLKFYLDNVLYAKEEDTEISFDNVGYDTLGNLVHMAMEHFINNPDMSYTEFEEYIKDIYESYNKFSDPFLGESSKKDDYFISSKNTYHFLKKFDLSNARSEYEITRNDNIELEGIYFHGSVDLIIKDKDEFIVIDYKTGKNVKHKEDDTISLLQALIYSSLLEKKSGLKVKKAMFYYSRIDHIVNVDLDTHHDTFIELLNKFKDTIKTNRYLPSEKKCDSCRFCAFTAICEETKKNVG